VNDQIVELCQPGFQLILYSPQVAALLEDGGNYGVRFPDGHDLIDYVNESRFAAIGTRWPTRDHWLHFSATMDHAVIQNATDHVRVGVEVGQGQLCVRGSDDLFQWTTRCPGEQIVSLDNGCYEVTACMVLDDEAELVRIYLHFAHVPARPELGYDRVPELYGESLAW
jgi:hypothetical protein